MKYILKSITLLCGLFCMLPTDYAISKTIKPNKSVKQSKIEKFKVTVPFEYYKGHIVLKVTIKGVEYRFMLDSGSDGNSISKKFALQLGLPIIDSVKETDDENNSSTVKRVKIDSIGIGAVIFVNSLASIENCSGLDGIIGLPIMKKAIWQINFKNQTIILTNSADSLNILPGSRVVSFNSKSSTFDPYINVLINGVLEKNVLVDLGSNFTIENSKRFLVKLEKNSVNMPIISGFGSSESSQFGPAKNSEVYFAKVSSVQIGNMIYKNQIMKFSDIDVDENASVGTGYLKNFITTFNWQKKQIILSPINQYSDDTPIHTFGFEYSYKKKNIYIDFIYLQSPADQAGIGVGDQIFSIDEMNCANFSPNEGSNLEKEYDAALKKNEIKLTVLTVKGEKKEVLLNTVDLLK